MLQLVKNFLYGLVFGVSLIVPGVSGGTLAIILGFYNQLIEAVNHFTEEFFHYLKFLAPFGIGIAVGIVAFASLIQFLLVYYSFPAMMFFIGLIAGIIPSIYKQTRINASDRTSGRIGLKWHEVALVLIPIGLLVLTAHLNDGAVAHSPADVDLPFMLFIFAIGVVAAASLLIPGLSGSFVLLVAGIYPLATYAVSSIRLLPGDITNMELIMDITRILGPLGVGIIVGMLFMARIIERLLKRQTRSVFLVVLGLMIGSVYALLVDPLLMQSGINAPIVGAGLVSLVVGVFISYRMGKITIMDMFSYNNQR